MPQTKSRVARMAIEGDNPSRLMETMVTTGVAMMAERIATLSATSPIRGLKREGSLCTMESVPAMA